MTWRERIPVGQPGRRIRKAFVAAVLFVCAQTASRLLRNPVFDGWWDAFTWPQLFLDAPALFFLGATGWQLMCFVVEWVHIKAGRKPQTRADEALQDNQRTPRFWLRDVSQISVLYITAAAIGDIPMVVRYLAVARGWPIHLWWSTAVEICLPFTIAVWWLAERFSLPRKSDSRNSETI